MAHAIIKMSKSEHFNNLFSLSQHCSSSDYFTGSSGRKRGHVWAEFALMHFNDWIHCCQKERKPPASGNANACCWDANTHVHIIIINNATRTLHRQVQIHTHTHTHTHTELWLRHCKEKHNQTRCVQWCCLNGVKQWSSLASESSRWWSQEAE